MMQRSIWFVRMDKLSYQGEPDISKSYPFIYSLHGSCGCQGIEEIQNAKPLIFPSLRLSFDELRGKIKEAKNTLIGNGVINPFDPGKRLCDLYVSQWIAEMKMGDIAIVRGADKCIYVTEITGYISEAFFEKYGSFQRPVEIIHSFRPSEQTPESKFFRLMERASGHRAIERNRDNSIQEILDALLSEIERK